jgi:2-oxoglutarate dehydrogenase E1 component
VSTLGFNTGYVEELYRQYLENPESVSESWREFFADYKPGESFVAAPEMRPGAEPARLASGERPGGDGAAPEPVAAALPPEEVEAHPLRGPAARIVENMEASLGIPTATSVRTVSVRLLAENRALINDYQRHVGGEKVSFTHLIAWAVVQALKAFPVMNAAFRPLRLGLRKPHPHG